MIIGIKILIEWRNIEYHKMLIDHSSLMLNAPKLTPEHSVSTYECSEIQLSHLYVRILILDFLQTFIPA